MIVVITGPTGVGKTKLSIELAKKLNAEIINGDSMQVYKELNIGTAKITEEEKEGIPHHLFDIVDVTDNYTVFDYQRDCRNIIEKLQKNNKNIIIIGGTGLYIKAALFDYKFDLEEDKKDYSTYTLDELIHKIKRINPNIDIDFSNRRRVERTLEKIENNSTFTYDGDNIIYPATIIGLSTNRDNLYNIINNRVDKMINNGLIEEVKSLYDRKIYSKAIKNGIGYKELYKYFDREINLDEAIDLIKKNSRKYAKRQNTFLKNKLNVKWFNVDYACFSNTITEVYNYIISKK